MRPGVDTVPYDKLKELRLEDGLDVSRKVRFVCVRVWFWGGANVGFACMWALLVQAAPRKVGHSCC